MTWRICTDEAQCLSLFCFYNLLVRIEKIFVGVSKKVLRLLNYYIPDDPVARLVAWAEQINSDLRIDRPVRRTKQFRQF